MARVGRVLAWIGAIACWYLIASVVGAALFGVPYGPGLAFVLTALVLIVVLLIRRRRRRRSDNVNTT